MSLTHDQLLERIETLETEMNQVQTAMNNLVTSKEVKNLFAILNNQIDKLSTTESIILTDSLIEKVNNLQTALNNVATKRTLNASVALKQKEIDDLKARVSILESSIAILQASA